MAYSTKADILTMMNETELAQLTSEQGDVIDDIIVAKVIADADGEIDSYLSQKYSVPLASTPAMVNNLSVRIARYNLYSRRAGQIGMNETVKADYENAIRFLNNVARGLVGVGVDPPPKGTTSVKVVSKGDERMFTKDGMHGF